MAVDSSSVLLQNARLVLPRRPLEFGWILVENHRIADLGIGEPPPGIETTQAVCVIDLKGQWVVPGFIDMHVHGADGADVMDGSVQALATIGRFHARHGTTGFLPTTLTAPPDAILKSVEAAQTWMKMARRAPLNENSGAAVLGVHLEGPFVSSKKIGAQNPQFVMSPSMEILEQLQRKAPGIVKKVTLAPELPDALQVISLLKEHHVIASMGHSDATFAQAMDGIACGAKSATHLFNAMRGLHHRDGGIVGASLYADSVVCELIADGHHVSPEVLELVYRLKGPKRIALITDAIAATGKPDGCYQLGGLAITVQGDRSLLEDGQTLAGSVLTMDRAVRIMVGQVGVSLADAVVMASTTPAEALGLGDRKGRLAVGFDADLVVLDESLGVTRTFVLGREVFCRA